MKGPVGEPGMRLYPEGDPRLAALTGGGGGARYLADAFAGEKSLSTRVVSDPKEAVEWREASDGEREDIL
jgi:hypothetical protein